MQIHRYTARFGDVGSIARQQILLAEDVSDQFVDALVEQRFMKNLSLVNQHPHPLIDTAVLILTTILVSKPFLFFCGCLFYQSIA